MNNFVIAENISRDFTGEQRLFSARPKTVHAVNSVSFSLARGECLGLVGESGCGKSTIARLLCGLLPLSSGTLTIDGKPLFALGEKNAAQTKNAYPVQMIFQDPFSSLNPRMRVGTTIAEALEIRGMPAPEREKRVQELLSLVGLPEQVATRYPHEFSGGQRQRIAIARALAPNPKLLICDEAVSALDVSVQAQVLNVLQDVQSRLSVTMLFISHDLAVVRTLCQRVAVMYLGRIVELAPAQALYSRPLHPYTETLLQAVPVPDPAYYQGTANKNHALSGEMPSPFAPPRGCHFHPRCVHATDICRSTVPTMQRVGAGDNLRHVLCHYPRNIQA